MAFKKEKEFFKILDDNEGWTTPINNKKTGLVCYHKTSARGMNLIKVKCPSDFDALTTFRAAGNSENRLKYDKNIQMVKPIEQVGANFLIGYQRTFRIFTVASRDMYNNVWWNIDDKGRYYLVLFDMAEDDLPEEEGCVRMLCPIGGFIFEPLPDDPSKCTMTMIAEGDVRGNIPKFAQKKAME